MLKVNGYGIMRRCEDDAMLCVAIEEKKRVWFWRCSGYYIVFMEVVLFEFERSGDG